MPTIDRPRLFDALRLDPFGGRLSRDQVCGTEAILDCWEGAHAAGDPRWLAYVLGTAFHETARTMQPIHEYGSAAYFTRRYDPSGAHPAIARALGNTEPGDGARFHGRGFVQLTGRRNYADWSARLGLDLLGEPDLCLYPAVAARILIEGSVLGTFTGRRLGTYFSLDREDWTDARRIINGQDRAVPIAGHAQAFHAALRLAGSPGSVSTSTRLSCRKSSIR